MNLGPIIGILVLLVLAFAAILQRRRTGWEISSYVATTSLLAALGTGLWGFSPHGSYVGVVGIYILGLAAAALLFGIVEFAILRFIGLFQLGAIARVTYYEALLQPFTLIIIFLGITAITLGGFLPYFTLNEDHKMYRDVAISLCFLFTLPVMIFSSTKTIDEEIENRTMLTLMSKPIARWQVVLGKYSGVLILCFVVIITLGIIAADCSYLRYFDDMRIDYQTSGPEARAELNFINLQALRALAPAILLQFLQIATLAAVSVAVSTRFGLAVNITAVVLFYIAANLDRPAAIAELPGPLHAIAVLISTVLPGLSRLDLNQRLVYSTFTYYGRPEIPGLPTYSQVWQYVALSAGYSLLYISAVLSFGIALFRNRELT